MKKDNEIFIFALVALKSSFTADYYYVQNLKLLSKYI